MKSACFANVHMTPQEYGVYCVIQSLTIESGIFYMDAETLAQCFSDRKPRIFYDIITSLIKKGWLRTIKASVRNKHGIPSAGQYATVSHAEWIKIYSNKKCRKPRTAEAIAAECDGDLKPTSTIAPECDKPLQPSAMTIAVECNDHCSGVQQPLHQSADMFLKNLNTKEYVSTNPSSNPTSAGGDGGQHTLTSFESQSQNRLATLDSGQGKINRNALWNRLLSDYKKDWEEYDKEYEEANEQEGERATKEGRKFDGSKIWCLIPNWPEFKDLPKQGIDTLVEHLSLSAVRYTLDDISLGWLNWLQGKFYNSWQSDQNEGRGPIKLPVAVFADEYELYIQEALNDKAQREQWAREGEAERAIEAQQQMAVGQ